MTSDMAADLTLETVLEIWQTTTDRLERTHLALQAEVRRLTAELEEKNRQLAKKNRLADLGQMAGHVAHEVRNHLVPMTLYLSLLKRNFQGEATAGESEAEPRVGLGYVEKMESNIHSMRSMVQDLLNFTANRQAQRQMLRAQVILSELADEIRPQCHAQGIELKLGGPAELEISGDPDMLRAALRNLLLNAVDVLGAGGRIHLSATMDQQGVRLTVADNGPGIPEDQIKRIFDPFFTTKPTGTGLGLSVVERIAECHQAELLVDSRLGVGSTFTLLFAHPASSNSNE